MRVGIMVGLLCYITCLQDLNRIVTRTGTEPSVVCSTVPTSPHRIVPLLRSALPRTDRVDERADASRRNLATCVIDDGRPHARRNYREFAGISTAMPGGWEGDPTCCMPELSRLWRAALGRILSCRSDDICMLDRHAEGDAVPDLGHAVHYLDLLVDSL